MGFSQMLRRSKGPSTNIPLALQRGRPNPLHNSSNQPNFKPLGANWFASSYMCCAFCLFPTLPELQLNTASTFDPGMPGQTPGCPRRRLPRLVREMRSVMCRLLHVRLQQLPQPRTIPGDAAIQNITIRGYFAPNDGQNKSVPKQAAAPGKTKTKWDPFKQPSPPYFPPSLRAQFSQASPAQQSHLQSQCGIRGGTSSSGTRSCRWSEQKDPPFGWC